LFRLILQEGDRAAQFKGSAKASLPIIGV